MVIGSAVYYSKAIPSKLREHFELIFVDLRHFVGSYTPTEKELNRISLETFIDVLKPCSRHWAWIDLPCWEDLVAGIDNIAFELLPNSSHSPQTEHPNDSDQTLFSWMTTH